jgi:hypothetical protein
MTRKTYYEVPPADEGSEHEGDSHVTPPSRPETRPTRVDALLAKKPDPTKWNRTNIAQLGDDKKYLSRDQAVLYWHCSMCFRRNETYPDGRLHGCAWCDNENVVDWDNIIVQSLGASRRDIQSASPYHSSHCRNKSECSCLYIDKSMKPKQRRRG